MGAKGQPLLDRGRRVEAEVEAPFWDAVQAVPLLCDYLAVVAVYPSMWTDRGMSGLLGMRYRIPCHEEPAEVRRVQPSFPRRRHHAAAHSWEIGAPNGIRIWVFPAHRHNAKST